MRRSITWLGAVPAAMVLSFAVAHAAEGKITAPKPVLNAVMARFKDARVNEVTKEVEKGATVYELSLTVAGKNVDATVTPGGTILLFEREIDRKMLPAAVTRTLETKYSGATYRIVEEIIKVRNKQEKLAFYEALLQTQARQWLALQISAAGKVMVEEKKTSGTLD